MTRQDIFKGPLINWKGAILEIVHQHQVPGEKRLRVKLLDGYWPSVPDLLMLCDGEIPSIHPSHFGGSLSYISDEELGVTVYTD